jgi:hypothetical protein
MLVDRAFQIRKIQYACKKHETAFNLTKYVETDTVKGKSVADKNTWNRASRGYYV